MSAVPFKGDRFMSRDKLKLILFDWLKEKGILGELQAFLRMKMVEKLQTTELSSSASKQVKFSQKDDSINKSINQMIYEYLKHHKMFYTSSVFASECSSIQQSNTQYLDWKDIINSLGVTNIKECFNMANDGKTCLLNCLLNAFAKISSKTFENKSCQCSDSKKLLLNAQSQTLDVDDKLLRTQSAQTLPTVCLAETQTEEKNSLAFERMSIANLNEEIANLQNRLEKSQSTLKLCQLKLQNSEDQIDYLLNHKNEPLIVEDNNTLLPIKTQPPPVAYNKNVRNRIANQKRIQEAFRFLDHLDGRLQLLDQKCYSVTAQNESHDTLRFLPDSSVYPL